MFENVGIRPRCCGRALFWYRNVLILSNRSKLAGWFGDTVLDEAR